MDVLCIGSAVIDISASPVGQKELWKEKQRIKDIRIQSGGDAANQSVRLADLGLHVSLAACVGDDQNGNILCDSLRARDVDTSFISVKRNCHTGTSLVLVDDAGERHTFSVNGAHSMLSKADLPDAGTLDCCAVSLASLFSMPELEQDGLLEFLKIIKQRNILVFADLASDKRHQGLYGIQRFLPYIDYFLPSSYDALEMTGQENVQKAAAIYQTCGAENVVIKCGSEGCYFTSKKQSGHADAIPVHPADTTGAGDCMAALFISRILQGDDMETACRFACAGASCSTLFPGAAQPRLSESMIREFMK